MGASKYRIIIWAGLLFIGFSLLGWLISWLLPETFGTTWSRGFVRPWEVPNVILAAPYVLLVASYYSVRRLNHHMLSHLWLYAIIVGAIGLVSALALGSLDSVSTAGWLSAAFTLAELMVLVWFARKVSAMSFLHSVLFIGLTIAVPNLTTLIPHEEPSTVLAIPAYIAILLGSAILSGIAVWALANTETVVSTTRSVLRPVIGIALLASVLFILANAGVLFVLADGDPAGSVRGIDWIGHLLITGLSSLIAPALAVAATYAVRVRRRIGQELKPTEV